MIPKEIKQQLEEHLNYIHFYLFTGNKQLFRMEYLAYVETLYDHTLISIMAGGSE